MLLLIEAATCSGEPDLSIKPDEYDLITLIEQEYHLSGGIPSKDVCIEKLGWTSRKFDALWNRQDFKDAMLARGINLETRTSGILTPLQLLAINTILDQNDNRSDKKKLADLKINTQTYQGWLRDPTFSNYLMQRCEALFPDALNEANRALFDNVRRGDLGSIKLLYAMTGRWSDKPVSEMNIEWVLMKVLETIQKHVTDPEILQGIATDLQGIQSEAVPTLQARQMLTAAPTPQGFAL